MVNRFLYLFIFLISSMNHIAHAQVQNNNHELVRQVVIFPFYAESELEKEVSSAWREVREQFTEHRRFLVASKRFMHQKNVFQPRNETLSTADAVLLGKLLNAHGLIVSQLNNRELKMTLYSGRNGLILWNKTYNLSPSYPLKDQIVKAFKKTGQELISSFPYQGYVITDPTIGTPVFERGSKNYVKVDAGMKSQIKKGEIAQVITIQRLNTEPLFSNGGQIRVIAEGEVISIKDGIAEIQIKKRDNSKEINTSSLVRFPNETQRLRSSMGLDTTSGLSPDIIIENLKETQSKSESNRSILTALGSILGIAALLILAL